MFYKIIFLSWLFMIRTVSFKQSQWYKCSVFQTNSHDEAHDEPMFLRIRRFLLKTELQGGAVFMVTLLLIWRLITMLLFFSRSDSEAVESNPFFESGCLLRHTLILSYNLQYVLLSGLISWHFLVKILYALLISFHFCVSFLSVAVPGHTNEPNIQNERPTVSQQL